MESLGRDARIALRSLARARGYTASVILTLAFGLALATAVLAVVNAYLVRSLPYPAASRLYNVRYAEPGADMPRGLAELTWSSLDDVVEHPIAWDLDMFYLLGGDYPERAPGAWVTPGFMNGLGIQPALGRAFTRDEFEPGGSQVALISHDLWTRRFGGDRGVIGRSFGAYVSDRPRDPELFTVVGVLPADFWHLNPYTEILTPLRATTYPYIVRLRENVAATVAEQRITALVRASRGELPREWRARLRPVHGEYVARMKPMLLAIAGAAGVVVVIACCNAALLTLLRGLRRRKDIAVRLSLGARPSQVARMLLTEAALLVAASLTAGTLLAIGMIRTLAPAIEQQLGRRVPGGLASLSIDVTVLAAIVPLALLIAGVLCLAPLLLTTRSRLSPALRQVRGGGRVGGDGRRGRRARFALIAVEVAGSLALLAGCGLMVRTVVRMLDVDLGMQTRQILAAPISLREQSYPDFASRADVYSRILSEAATMRGVALVAMSSPSPLVSFEPQAARADASEAPRRAAVREVGGDYFQALDIALARGRTFTASDRRGNPIAMVSESAARTLWPDEDAVGKRVYLADRNAANDTVMVARTVVGVVRDVRQSPTDSVVADVYVPLLQSPSRFAAIVARTTRASPDWLDELRRIVRTIDPQVAVSPVQDLDVELAGQLARPRFLVMMFSLFGGFASLLGVMGLDSVIAYAVRQREHEVAVRIAVGADARAITGLFLREGIAVVTIGLVAGVAGAIAVGRLLEAQLFGVRALDPATLIAAAATLAAAAVAAIWWPARRAALTDPVIALKEA